MCAPMLAGAGAAGGMSASSMMGLQIGMAAMSSMVSYMGQMAAVAASVNAANATMQSAADAYNHNNMVEELKIRQEEKQTSLEAQQLAIDRKQAQGAALASAEGAGASLENLIADYYRQEGFHRSVLEQDLGMKKVQSYFEKEKHYADAKDRIASAQASILPTPSILGAIVPVIGAGLNATSTYKFK